MAAVMTPQKPTTPMRFVGGDDYVMDTRTPSPILRASSDDSGSEQGKMGAGKAPTDKGTYQPDLGSEVAMLSTKLINAINYQTNLDDSLQAAKHELDQVQTELRRVRAEKQSLDDAIAQGVLVRKADFELTISKLRADVAEERTKREIAEKLKKQTEGELETLTSALFEEANTMVAAARKDTEAAEKRISQLKGQLQDTEFMMASQQEQLQDMKNTMEKMDHTGTEPRDPSIPSTPDMSHPMAGWDGLHEAPTSIDILPEHPLFFSHLLQPVLRADVSAYADFAELLSIAQKAASHSRTASGNVTTPSQSHLGAGTSASGSSPSLPGAFSFTTSANTSPSSATFGAALPTLKESKFYKRALLEDIEPTLRLDLAPGLTFLSRRSVLSSLLNGSLAVEPFVPSNYKFYAPVFACSLCGESRKHDPYIRKHRFRTSESDDAQRYPLCDYCLGRIRATGNFLGFLRLVRDGHWRCESEDEEKGAWEEAVRLRERMFWARIGGGVIPAALRRDQLEASREAQSDANTAEPDQPSDLAQEATSPADSTGENAAEADVKSSESETTARDGQSQAEHSLAEGELSEQPAVESADFEPAAINAEHESSPAMHNTSESSADDTAVILTAHQENESISPETHEQSPEEEQSESLEEAKPSSSRPSTPRHQTKSAPVASPERRPQPQSPERRPESSASARSQLSSRHSRDSSSTKFSGRVSSPPTLPVGTDERKRPSSVLDRIRAMEAKSSEGGDKS